METWVDVFWSSAVNVLVFVFIAQSLQSGAGNTSGISVMVGIILWNFIWCGQYSIAVGALWEIWSRSFNTLFITPLTLEEFLVGQMISGIMKGVVAAGIAAIFVFFLSHYSILTIGWPLLLYIFELIVFSWSIGMFVLSLIFRLGMNVQSLSWVIVYLVQPFGGMFFSVSLLPVWVQKISWMIPSTYVFESIRYQLTTGTVNVPFMIQATALNVGYLIGGYVILRITIAWAKRSGAYAKMNG
jgi:ABC-2 type transport system permease protein